MKKFLLLFLLLAFSFCLYAYEKILYENDKLLITSESKMAPGIGYEHVFYYFRNRTNNTLRVNYRLKVRFIRFGKDMSKTGTLYLKPHEFTSVYPAELDPNAAHSSVIMPIDFELINFSEKIENKEVPW